MNSIEGKSSLAIKVFNLPGIGWGRPTRESLLLNRNFFEEEETHKYRLTTCPVGRRSPGCQATEPGPFLSP